MLGHDIEIVAVRVQRRNAQLLALLPIIAMIVVCTEHRHMLSVENLGDASTQCRLASSTVTHDAHDDRTRHCSKRCSHSVLVLQTPCNQAQMVLALMEMP